jgi:feruloyl-CoA synthase
VFAPPRISREDRADGTILLSSRDPLRPHARSLGELLRAGASAHPDRVVVARRNKGGLDELTYGAARTDADALAQAFLDRGLGPDRPVLVLSGNSVEQARITFAAYTAGIPVVPVSVAYSLATSDHARIRAIAELTRPGLVFADDPTAFGPALAAVAATGAEVVAGADALAALLRTAPTDAVEQAYRGVGPDTVAKILFTSGSTGNPKGVLNTHGMLCSNQQQMRQVWTFLAEPPVLVDWLPWSHTFGGNHNLNMILANGGTLHIDDGKPTPALFELTVAALAEIAPTAYFNVPMGYAMLVPRLEADRELAARFFSRLQILFYAAASLPEALWHRLRALAEDVAGREIPVTSSWGTTETGPAVTSAHYDPSPSGCIGVPIPGDTLKLVRSGDKLEIRVKGPNITPGYLGLPEATAAAFDDEGFYVTGDAVRFVDPDDPNLGLLFDGRIAEDFKLTSGTWVSVGTLRTALVSAAGGLLTDAVIAGHDGEYAGALAWPNAAAVTALTGESDLDAALRSPVLRERLGAALATLNRGQGSSARIERLLLLREPASLDAGEITDKGYVNQRVVLDRRADAVATLLADSAAAEVLVPAVAARGIGEELTRSARD